MIFISDVHDSPALLEKVVQLGEYLIILGDLANLTDYRTGEGAVAEVLGIDFARDSARSRGRGDYPAMRALWADKVGMDSDEIRLRIGTAIDRQYAEAARALEGGKGIVIHGNVDRPARLIRALPPSFEYVQGEAIDVEGYRIGLVGGGVPTPMQAEGEVSNEEMGAMLSQIGPVDILCTHVPPSTRALRYDVVTGKEERGSEPILDYIRRHQPRLHVFGDVHQAQANTWRLGRTRCVNVGYFRATGRYLRLGEGALVEAGRVG